MKYERQILKECLALLDKTDHRKLIVLNFFQALFQLMDLVAIALVGVVTSLSVRYLSGEEEGNRTRKLVELLGMLNLSPQTRIMIFAVLASVLFVARSFVSYFFNKRVAIYVANKSALLSSNLLEKLFANPLDVVQKSSSQSGIYFVTQGVGQVLASVVVPFYALIPDFVYAFVIFSTLFYFDALTVIILVSIFIFAATILFRIQKRRTIVLGAKTTKLNLETANVMAEALSAFREISARGAQEIFINNLTSLRLELANSQAIMKLQNVLSRYFLEALMVLSVFCIAVVQVFSRDAFTSTSNLAIFVAASARILPVVVKLQNLFLQIKGGLASSVDVLHYVEQLELSRPLDTFEIKKGTNEIPVRLKDVSFSYGNSPNRNFCYDLEIGSGNFFVITGQTGIGKSTLLDLTLGIQTPEKGSVEIFGDSPKEFLRNQIGKVAYVPQYSFIKNASLLENLMFALPKNFVTEDLISELLRKMNWHPMFQNRELLNINLGEGGQVPSGGERQVIGIARALLTRPALMFLDESTSSMDATTEKLILKTLRAEENLTVVMVTHKLSVILSATQILFFERNGNQVKASFKELRKNNLEFSRLIDSLTEIER